MVLGAFRLAVNELVRGSREALSPAGQVGLGGGGARKLLSGTYIYRRVCMRCNRPRLWLGLAFFLGVSVLPLGTIPLRGEPTRSQAEVDGRNAYGDCAKFFGDQSPNAGGLTCETGPGKCVSF